MKLVAESLPIEITCDIHPWMTAYVMVFDHPFFATTAKDGSFEIQGVPAGTQNLVLWQAKVGFATPGVGRGMPIEVKADEVTDVGNIVLCQEGHSLAAISHHRVTEHTETINTHCDPVSALGIVFTWWIGPKTRVSTYFCLLGALCGSVVRDPGLTPIPWDS